MEDWAPMKATLAACSMGWPVVASLGVVLWSKARARSPVVRAILRPIK
ncbi:MAG: hypothetical protein JWQ46_3184 [Phenylobacterium sp.]|nr:hypothetical protein [Phenylobacterium sp.]